MFMPIFKTWLVNYDITLVKCICKKQNKLTTCPFYIVTYMESALT